MGTGEQLGRVIDDVESLAAALEPETISPAAAVALLEQATRLHNLTGAIRTMVAARAASSAAWRRDGARTEAEWLALRMGATEGEARDVLDTSKALGSLAKTDEAFRAGPAQPATCGGASPLRSS